jgi:hypothetical protein
MRNSATPTRVAIAVVAAIAAAVSLSGCVQASHVVIPTSAPSVAPVFASDAQALAAAEKAFTGYLAASDTVAHEGGEDINQLSTWDTAAQFARDKKTFSRMQAAGEHTIGSSTFSRITLQSNDSLAGRKVLVVIYGCLDISQTHLFDRSNQDISARRITVVPLVVSFTNQSSSQHTLLLDRSVTWQGTNFCS